MAIHAVKHANYDLVNVLLGERRIAVNKENTYCSQKLTSLKLCEELLKLFTKTTKNNLEKEAFELVKGRENELSQIKEQLIKAAAKK